MYDARISQLDHANPLSGNEFIPITQRSQFTGELTTMYTSPSAIRNYIFGSYSDAFCPPGSITAYACPVYTDDTPPGWLLCNGKEVLRAQYPRLFNRIGTTYGSTSEDTFKLPDLRGRAIAGFCSTEAKKYFPVLNQVAEPYTVGFNDGAFRRKITYQLPTAWEIIDIPVAKLPTRPPVVRPTIQPKTVIDNSNVSITSSVKKVGEQNKTETDAVTIDDSYDYYAVGGYSGSFCRAGGNVTTIDAKIDGKQTSYKVADTDRSAIPTLLLFAVKEGTTYFYKPSDTEADAIYKASARSTVNFDKVAVLKKAFDLARFAEIQSASVTVTTKSIKQGDCYGGMTGATIVLKYKAQPAVQQQSRKTTQSTQVVSTQTTYEKKVLLNRFYNHNTYPLNRVGVETLKFDSSEPVELTATFYNCALTVNNIQFGYNSGQSTGSNTVTKTIIPDANSSVRVQISFSQTSTSPAGASVKIEANIPTTTTTTTTVKDPICKELIYDYTGDEAERVVSLKMSMPNGVIPLNTKFNIHVEQGYLWTVDRSGKKLRGNTGPNGGTTGKDWNLTMSPDKNGDVQVIHKGGGWGGEVVCQVYVDGACDDEPAEPVEVESEVINHTVGYTEATVMVPSTKNIPVDVTQPYITTNYIIKY